MAAGVFADLTFDLKGRRSSRRTCCFRRGSVPVARLVDFLATLLATSAAAGSLRRSGAGRRVGSSLTDKPATAAGYRVRETAQVIVACLTLAGGLGGPRRRAVDRPGPASDRASPGACRCRGSAGRVAEARVGALAFCVHAAKHWDGVIDVV